MRKIFATYINEWHLTRRDLGGLALLFIMPLFLIIIMALVQDAPFKDYKDITFESLFINNDSGTVGKKIEEGLYNSKQFKLLKTPDGFNQNRINQAVLDGTFKMAISVPKGATAEVINSANKVANTIGAKMGIRGTFPTREPRDSIKISVLFDPTTKPTLKVAILNVLEKFTGKIQTDIILERIAKLSNNADDTTSLDIEKSLRSLGVVEQNEQHTKKDFSRINSVQHNVPAWSVFGIFFMILIIAQNTITERKSGSYRRLLCIPNTQNQILIGKVLFYLMLGMMQFMVMLLVGKYAMPWFGLPALKLGGQYINLFFAVFCNALCATSLGILLGSFFNTTNQALPVGAMSIVILSAIGGIWIPLEILPQPLKTISVLSPLKWGLEAVNAVLLRNTSFIKLLKPCSVLILLSIIFVCLSHLNRKRLV